MKEKNKVSVLLVLFITLVSFSTIGQTNKFTLSGKVTDCRTLDSIEGVTIKLVGSDGSSIETKSDSSGNYSFSNCFKNNTNYAVSTKVGNYFGRGPAIKYGLCPYEFYEKCGYFDDYTKYNFFYSDTLQSRRFDICLPQTIIDYNFPTFYFKKNSTEFQKIEWLETESTDTVIDCYAAFLLAHKSWTIIISSHSSKDENNKKELAEARAKKLFDLLVSKGIEPTRLVCKSYSDTKPYEFWDDMTNKKIKKSENITNEKSRRITIGLLKRDYNK